MQFEKIFVNNENGKINGYHQRGRYENGKIELSMNEKIGEKYDSKLNHKNNNDSIQKTSDEEFIKYCEHKLDRDAVFNNANKLKAKLRRCLESDLNEEVLIDFKILVSIINSQEKTAENRKVIEQLINKYSDL